MGADLGWRGILVLQSVAALPPAIVFDLPMLEEYDTV